MPVLRRFLSRRWLLAFLGGAAFLFGLAMLHPYPRQSLFGPTIRGKPQCFWESEVRRFGDRPTSLTDTLLGWFGIQREELTFEEVFDDPEMVPIVADMLYDPDSEARYWALFAIAQFPTLQDQRMLAPLRSLVDSGDVLERGMAGYAIWRVDKDQKMIPFFLDLLAQDNAGLHGEGTQMVATELRTDESVLLSHLAARASDPNPKMRRGVMTAIIPAGKKGVPILIKGLNDSNLEVCRSATWALHKTGPDAADAIPALKAQLNHGNASVREASLKALRSIDPKQFD